MKTTSLFTSFARSTRRRGFSLTEVMIAVAIFAVTLLGFWAGLIAIRIQNRELSQQETGYSATRELMELVRGLGFSGLNYSPDASSGLDPVALKRNDARWASRTSDPSDWNMPIAPVNNSALPPGNASFVQPEDLFTQGTDVQWKTMVIEDAYLNSSTSPSALFTTTNNYGQTSQLVNARWTARIWHYRTASADNTLTPAALSSVQPALVFGAGSTFGPTGRQWEYKELEVTVQWRPKALTGRTAGASDAAVDRAWRTVWLRSVVPSVDASAL